MFCINQNYCFNKNIQKFLIHTCQFLEKQIFIESFENIDSLISIHVINNEDNIMSLTEKSFA